MTKVPPYVVTYSDQMRLAAQIWPSSQQKVQMLAEDAVNTILETEGVADSIKKDSIVGFNAIRQIDMKNEDMKIILKTFTGWNKNLNCWHVFVEFPTETFWEEQYNVGKG